MSDKKDDAAKRLIGAILYGVEIPVGSGTLRASPSIRRALKAVASRVAPFELVTPDGERVPITLEKALRDISGELPAELLRVNDKVYLRSIVIQHEEASGRQCYGSGKNCDGCGAELR